MSKTKMQSQKGIAHIILIIIILAAGLLGGLYLVQHPTVFKPRADTNGSQCTSVLAVFSTSNTCQLAGRGGTGFTTIDYRCNLNGASTHSTITGDCRSEDDWRLYAQSQCNNLCTNSNTLPPPPTIATSSATLANNTCDISFNNVALDGQTISGNTQIVATANKSNATNYLSVWVNSDKQGGLFQVGSTQTNNMNVNLNTPALFSNGPATIECRIQTTQSDDGVGTHLIYGGGIHVNVSNTASGTGALSYSCGISGPNTVSPGQQVTFTDSSTSSINDQPIDRWGWGSLVGDPAISWIDTSRTFSWTAPTTPGVYPNAVNHSIHVANIPNAATGVWTTACFKTITVSGTQEWHYCAQEGSTSVINGQTVGALCKFNGIATVRYGREPVWYTKTGVQGQIACNSQTFGYPPNLPNDPNDQKVKHCEYKLE
jgi:hypothetical protein